MLKSGLAIFIAFMSLATSNAAAMPGDAPFAPTAPADGASATVNPDGIPVAFTCPGYRIDDPGGGFITPGGPKDYGVIFSLSPALGADGKLMNAVALGRGEQPPGSAPDTCVSSLNAGGSTRPQETPGTYYWQVYRICFGCPGRFDEVGPVRSLTLVSNAKPTLKLPSKVYANFPFIATVGGEGLPNFSTVTVERATGSTWSKVRADSIAGGTADVTLTVKGRTIRGFTASVPMTCPGTTPGQFTTQIGTAKFGTIKLAPDGSFVGVNTSGNDTSMRVRGRLVNAKLTGGRIELSVGTCVGTISFQVKHA